MAFTKTFPYDIGAFVIVNPDMYDKDDPETLKNQLGTITCYQCVKEDDELLVMVSGYKNAWCGEYLLNDIRLATDLEVDIYKDIMDINDQCEDCRYYINNNCTHPHSVHCEHCELWSSKWY